MADQPNGWIGGKDHLDSPVLTNLRLDPFERTAYVEGNNGSYMYFSWFQYEFWRFVFVQQEVAKLAMQKGASFNLDAVKAKIEEVMKQQAGQ